VGAALGVADGSAGLWLQRATLLLMALSGLSLLSLFARWSVLCELFTHFRLQYLLLQAVTLVLVLAQRRLDLAILVALMALPHLVAIAPYLPGTFRAQGQAPAAAGPRVVALNLQYNNDDFERARNYLLDAAADVLVLSEFTPRAAMRLAFLDAEYPHRVLRPKTTAWGMAVYSRLPFLEVADLPLDQAASAQLRVRVAFPAGPVDLYAVHLASPMGAGRAALRNAQLQRLAAEVRAAAVAEPRVPPLVVGDLNLTPFSPHFAALLRTSGLSDSRRPFGLHVTWPARALPLWIPIDHCLVGGSLRAGNVVAGPPMGSDHLPLEIRLAWSQP
jgi:endonuclease/exonuclease/phosphatase (EEP) superfamily protein YafD